MELFSTIGKVDRAEIQYEPNGRSRGTGVVQFDTPDNAATAIGKSSTPSCCRLPCSLPVRKIYRLPVRWTSSRSHLRQIHEPQQRRHHGRNRRSWRDDARPDHVTTPRTAHPGYVLRISTIYLLPKSLLHLIRSPTNTTDITFQKRRWLCRFGGVDPTVVSCCSKNFTNCTNIFP